MPTRVVTLPRGAEAVGFARHAKALGAQALEVRDDFTEAFDAEQASRVLPLLLAHRGGPGFGPQARRVARWEDAPAGPMVSLHALEPLSPEEAERRWARCTARLIKHVEPLGPPQTGARLLETQRRLIARFGEGRVTVLATGDAALPFRAVLAARNAFDYLAVDGASASAAGQRLLADAVRADHAHGPRLALIGHRIAHARSPCVHPQPFDRWDLPPHAPARELIDALRPHYRGFAVTAPFKRAFGAAAVNTLVRRPDGWAAYNTDVEGARAVLARYGVERFTVLGSGGAAWALQRAGPATVLRAADAGGRRLGGDVVWTWPDDVEPPLGLRLDGARVLVIAYGPPAARVAARVRGLGGTPVRAGPTWFIAQARAQARLWREAA